MNINNWIALIKENKIYLIVFILGLIVSAIGGIYVNAICGKIVLGIGIVISIISAIVGLRNKSLEWEEFD